MYELAASRSFSNSNDGSDAESFWNAAAVEPISKEQNGASTVRLSHQTSWLDQTAGFMARNACTWLGVALTITSFLSLWGLCVSQKNPASDSGWWTRGTVVSNRCTQIDLLIRNRDALFEDKTGEVWKNLTTMRRFEDGYVVFPVRSPDLIIPKGLDKIDGEEEFRQVWAEFWPTAESPTSVPSVTPTVVPTKSPAVRAIEEETYPINATMLAPTFLPTRAPIDYKFPPCDTPPYLDGSLFSSPSLWPIWKIRDQDEDFLSGPGLQSLCEQEEITQEILFYNDLCQRCGNGEQCYQPYSLVFLARLTHPFGMLLNCSELGNAWDSISNEVVPVLKECAVDINNKYDQRVDGLDLPDSCPLGFSTHMIDGGFYSTGKSVYSSTIFVTQPQKTPKQFQLADSYAQGDNKIVGVYDTQFETFLSFERDISLSRDVSLAIVSAFVVAGMMIVHTKSLFLTLFGLMQMSMSLPIAYLCYSLGFDFFASLNLVGIFVVFALGADNVFVVVDKWNSTRTKYPDASTESIAAMALPDASNAMFLTNSSTAIAFLASARTPILPLKSFSIFVGLLVSFDYLLCLLLVFPALCVYDRSIKWRWLWHYEGKRTMSEWYISCSVVSDVEDPGLKPESAIRRILRNYHKRLHHIREPALGLCFVVVAISLVQASRMRYPLASARLFEPDDNQFAQRFHWNHQILREGITISEASTVNLVWGLYPADTGDYRDPEAASSLVLDDTFDPSHASAQCYFRDICDRLFQEKFAFPINGKFICPMKKFDNWLKEQFSSLSKTQAYLENCGNMQQLPIPSNIFDSCVYAWSQLVEEKNVLTRTAATTESSTLRIETISVSISGKFHQGLNTTLLDRFCHRLESWLTAELSLVPDGMKGPSFWNKDNQLMNHFQCQVSISQQNIFTLADDNFTISLAWGDLEANTCNTVSSDGVFDPSKPHTQTYLRDFCDRLLEQEFLDFFDDHHVVCPMRHFESWLQEQYASSSKSQAYIDHCGNTQQLPVPSSMFSSCVVAWTISVHDRSVDLLLTTNAPPALQLTFMNETNVTRKVAVIVIPFKGQITPASDFNTLNGTFNTIQAWVNMDRATAPKGANNAFFGGKIIWLYDTIRILFITTLASCFIAMCSTGFVIFFSSKSFILTLFSMISVGYVIISVAAMLVTLGWTIGFLESILFSILIGLSCDFVVHFCHAYSQFSGHAPRSERTLYAVITMGPSILAAAFSTMSVSLIMCFATLVFFQRFGAIMLFAMLQACIGSFVLFIVMADFAGPCYPSQTVDRFLSWLFGDECYGLHGVPYDPNLEVLRGKNPEWPVVTVGDRIDE